MFDLDSFQKSYKSSVPLRIFLIHCTRICDFFFRNGFSVEDAELDTSLRFSKLQTTVRTQI